MIRQLSCSSTMRCKVQQKGLSAVPREESKNHQAESVQARPGGSTPLMNGGVISVANIATACLKRVQHWCIRPRVALGHIPPLLHGLVHGLHSAEPRKAQG